jgi:hypothetical protein
MEHIKALQGFGAGKTCIIIGGGHSLNEFEWDKLPKDIYIITCNTHMRSIANMIIYYDKGINTYYEKHLDKVPDETVLIGFRHNTINHVCQRCNYYYNYNDILFGDTGFHSLQFADGLFNFSVIYIIGYDYYTLEASYHWNEKESETTAMVKFKTHSINKVRLMYKDYKWQNSIFNCSSKSKLKTFEYGLPYITHKES